MALARKRSFGKDADDAAPSEHAKGTLDGAWIRSLEVHGDRPDAPAKGRMERARAEDARHDQKADGARDGHPEHDPVEVVVVIGREDERLLVRQPLEPRDIESEQSTEREGAGRADQLIERREPAIVGARTSGPLPIEEGRAEVPFPHAE